MGAAYGTAKSGVGISSMGVMNPQLVMRNMIPVVMAGVLGIYGLIISVILTGNSLALIHSFMISRTLMQRNKDKTYLRKCVRLRLIEITN